MANQSSSSTLRGAGELAIGAADLQGAASIVEQSGESRVSLSACYPLPSKVWARSRQSPEWKPRRASVASCQLYHQQCTFNSVLHFRQLTTSLSPSASQHQCICASAQLVAETRVGDQHQCRPKHQRPQDHKLKRHSSSSTPTGYSIDGLAAAHRHHRASDAQLPRINSESADCEGASALEKLSSLSLSNKVNAIACDEQKTPTTSANNDNNNNNNDHDDSGDDHDRAGSSSGDDDDDNSGRDSTESIISALGELGRASRPTQAARTIASHQEEQRQRRQQPLTTTQAPPLNQAHNLETRSTTPTTSNDVEGSDGSSSGASNDDRTMLTSSLTTTTTALANPRAKHRQRGGRKVEKLIPSTGDHSVTETSGAPRPLAAASAPASGAESRSQVGRRKRTVANGSSSRRSHKGNQFSQLRWQQRPRSEEENEGSAAAKREQPPQLVAISSQSATCTKTSATAATCCAGSCSQPQPPTAAAPLVTVAITSPAPVQHIPTNTVTGDTSSLHSSSSSSRDTNPVTDFGAAPIDAEQRRAPVKEASASPVVSEQLEFQRKYHIFSMALKQMMISRNHVTACGVQPECRCCPRARLDGAGRTASVSEGKTAAIAAKVVADRRRRLTEFQALTGGVSCCRKHQQEPAKMLLPDQRTASGAESACAPAEPKGHERESPRVRDQTDEFAGENLENVWPSQAEESSELEIRDHDSISMRNTCDASTTSPSSMDCCELDLDEAFDVECEPLETNQHELPFELENWRPAHMADSTTTSYHSRGGDIEASKRPKQRRQQHYLSNNQQFHCKSDQMIFGANLSEEFQAPLLTSTGSTIADDCDEFEALIVESWLDDHPNFVHDYFMRKANHQLIDDWLITQAKVSNTNLTPSLARPLSQRSLSAANTEAGGAKKRDHLGSIMRPSAEHNSLNLHSAGEQHQHLIFRSHQQPNRRHQSQQQHRSSVGPISMSTSSSIASISRANSVMTPVRKISATDFESRTGSGLLGPILSTTPDGKPTFLSSETSGWCVTNQQANQRRRDRLASVGGEIASVGRKLALGSTVGIRSVAQERDAQVRAQQQHDKLTADRDFGNSIANLSADQSSDQTESAKNAQSINNPPSASERRDRARSISESNCDKITSRDAEVEMIFELVKNICDDLDIRTLLHKILKNIAVLINADKSSLFLVCGDASDPNRHLVSHLFNVDQESELDELEALAGNERADSNCIRIPWATGLVGYVAESGESVNIENCYEDPRFTDAIDQRTGYLTRHMLCAPIYDKENVIVGVAQVINKRDGKPFSESDELKFKRYLQFCGIGLRNAQSYEQCQLENKRNQVLLDLARMVFEEQSTIEQVVYRIMLHTQSLLDCERCQVLLIDDGSDDLDQLLQLPTATAYKQRVLSVDADAELARPHDAPKWRPQCNPNPEADALLATIRPGVGSALSDQAQSTTDDEATIVAENPTPQRVNDHQPQTKLFSLVFDLECNDGNDPVIHSNRSSADTQSPGVADRRFPINIGITSYVAMTGETLNVEDAHQHERFDPSVDEGSSFRHRSILCMPIRNGQRQIIGVSQLINKKNGKPFNKNDENLFEAFAIFCGLGIHNTLMYERVLKVMAKQRVTFEVLSYHATAPLEEAKKLHQEQIPSCYSLNLASFKFNDFSLDEQYMLKSCLRFFLDLDLIRRFQIDQLVFCNWILSVQKNYRKVTYHPIVGGNGLKAAPVRYHNWRHAFNVSQMMFAILVNTQICHTLGELETLALLIACLCHDLDHRGTNNSFQIKSASPLAELYSTSTMEHHHFDQCVMILNSQGNQILSNLSPSEYSRVIVLLEEAILATDLANYFMKRDRFFQLVNSNQFDWKHDPEHRSLLRCMLMTACDVAAITKPWPVQKVVADLVMSEFYQQGDIEKNELKIQPIDMMNRDKMSELPEMQISFIDTICAPIYTAFAKLFPRELGLLLDGCLSNRNLWTEMAARNNATRNNNNRVDSISMNTEPDSGAIVTTSTVLSKYLDESTGADNEHSETQRKSV